MNRETMIWWGLFILGAAFLVGRIATLQEFPGKVYVVSTPVEQSTTTTWTNASRNTEGAVISPSRTFGVWIAAFLTLCIFSYLYRDNPFYRFSEAVFVGVSAGYAMVAGFWDSLVNTLLVKLSPGWTRLWAVPTIEETQKPEWIYVIPLILGLLLFARFFLKLSGFCNGPWRSSLERLRD